MGPTPPRGDAKKAGLCGPSLGGRLGSLAVEIGQVGVELTEKLNKQSLYVGRNLEVGPCGQFTQRLRRDTGELAVFHDDEIRTGLDRGPPRSLVCTLHGGGA